MTMGLGGGGCSPTEFLKRVTKVAEKFDNFTKTPEGREVRDASAVLDDVFYAHFRRPVEQALSMKPDHAKVKAYENHMEALMRNIKSGKFENNFMNWMYNTSSRVKKFPMMAKLYEELGRAEHSYKARQYAHESSFKNILKSIKEYAVEQEYVSKGNDINKANKKAQQFEREVERLAAEMFNENIDPVKAMHKLSDALNIEKTFYNNQEGRAFRDIISLIEGGTKTVQGKEVAVGLKGAMKAIQEGYLAHVNKGRELIAKKGKYLNEAEILEELAQLNIISKADPKLARQISDGRKSFNTIVDGLTKSPSMRKALKEYVHLMEDMHRTLTKGVESTVESIKISMKEYNLGDARNKQTGELLIDEIAEKLKKKMTPNQEKGYYPHYRRVLLMDYMEGLMPKLQAVQDKLGDSLRMDKKGVNDALEQMHSYVTGHASNRRELKIDVDKAMFDEYSLNFLSNIKRYVNEVDRFNYISNVDKFSKETLSEIKKVFRSGNETEGIASDAVKMLYELNQAAKGGAGTKFENPQVESMAQMALGMEFVSKIGLNPRSAGFNATQYLLNMVEYGPSMMRKANDFYRTEKIGGQNARFAIEDMLYKTGLLFTEGSPELMEISGHGAAGSFTKFKVHGKRVEYVEPSKLDTMEGLVRTAAEKGGKLMALVENRLRTSTFKFGFYRHYETLRSDNAYRDKLAAEGLTDSQIEQRFISESRNAAINDVALLHFNYSAKSKAKFLRDPRFRFLGQFQHYAFKMVEYNANLVKGMKNDYAEGKMLGPEAMKAYRMGMVYFLAPAIASSVTGIEWGNLVENATATRLEQMYTLFTGEDEDIEKAFYGRGPLLGSLGAPLFSDLIKMGQIMEFYDMDEDSKLGLITGFTDYANATGDEKAYEIARILNTSLSRQYYQNFPLLAGGKIGNLVQFEMGLYPTKAAKEKKKKLAEVAPGIEQSLEQLIEHAKKGKYYQGG